MTSVRVPAWLRPGARLRRWAGRVCGPGLACAEMFFVLALGPALTPRPAVLQGSSAGVCAAIGYGLGTGVVAVARRVRPTLRVSAWWRALGWRLLGFGTPFAVVGGLAWSARWQRALRDVMGMPQPAGSGALLTFAVSLGVALLLLTVARGLRVTVRAAARLVGRWWPPVVSRAAAVAVVALVAVLVLNGTAAHTVRSGLERSFAGPDRSTSAGSTPPTAAERSGSPASRQAWSTLGREGRQFVSTGPTLADLRRFDAAQGLVRTEREPIRVYAGRASAGSLDGVAANVVAELDRTDAWDRAVLVVATTTGTGWVDPAAARALELAWGGDTAVAAMQYSYLPSWVGFVGDRTTPVLAGRALFDAVHAAWAARPVGHRPRLDVFGVSLGSFGSQGAFSSLDDVLARTDGAVWAGTPGFTPLWQQLTAERDPSSTQLAPVLDGGRHARWGASLGGESENLLSLGDDWSTPRVVYLQHASDGITWWSPDLLFRRPDWLAEPRGADVLPQVRWVPIVSFWQLSVDLFAAGEAPPGYGHTFATEYADAWVAVATPPGWTADDTAALRAALTPADRSGGGS